MGLIFNSVRNRSSVISTSKSQKCPKKCKIELDFKFSPKITNVTFRHYTTTEVVTEDGRRVKCLRRDTYLDMSQMALTIFPKMVLRCDDLETLLFSRNFLR